MNDIHNMKLHEMIQIELERGDVYVGVLRVPGGWIYEYETNLVFIPLSREFHKPQVSSNIEPASKGMSLEEKEYREKRRMNIGYP